MSIASVTKAWAEFKQSKISDFWTVLVTRVFTEPNVFYASSTLIFSLLFLLIFAYYRLRGLAKDYHNIVMIKRNLEAIAKSRLKRYLLQSAQFYY
ncbi:phospho-N-acetylmuramoyl-pentapeptide-transferas e [Babesia ovata]|uniref:Phospho-N-acetylmuramoyl-pentapeptide-transferas e n=1 Tax=Babesia ovata TaxID=189622 RepID=A0A2H6KBP3_9APIC|nr:phospho-N-acetylmuramoyl-pentapeptide-transferas e [Babesia ovata]GBE60407.1 phospho-N-acetylmuramoyl-pentapeptide-transferas e [Babesia ovata]